ncbi:MAG: DUF938 domain-containing protein [Pleurocapsa sp.]
MDARQFAPTTQRNREPILEVLKRVFPPTGDILEIASGTGEHGVFFAPHFAPRIWIPSDPNPLLRDSIIAWRKFTENVDNLNKPRDIDANDEKWSIENEAVNINAIVNINMIHISPWTSCLGLMAGASRILSSGGILYLYGPFKRNGEHTAFSNVSFDESLRRQNSQWGVRDLEAVARIANSEGFTLEEVVSMPANNFSVIFKRQ